MNNRIKFAYYLSGWKYDPNTKHLVKEQAQKVLPEQYQPEMDGWLFCPECFMNLYRSPKEKAQSENGRKAFFGHNRGTSIECGLRSKRAEGKRYSNEEEAQRAIQSEELVIVAGFLNEPPTAPDTETKEYDQTKVEELDGPTTEVAIARHRGESFSLPSKFKTIRGITTKFDENIHRYFFMPVGQYAVQLQDLLVNIENVKATDKTPRLYYGKIVSSANAGKKPTNIRMTKLKYNRTDSEYADFYFKLQDREQKDKGIDDDSAGRVLIVYGKVTESGAGLSIEKAGWGEFALLPKKYENLLYS